MLLSLSLVLNFVMKSPAADNALSDSMDVDGTVFKASMRNQIPRSFKVIFEGVSYFYYPMVRISSITVAISCFSVGLIKDD